MGRDGGKSQDGMDTTAQEARRGAIDGIFSKSPLS